MLPVETPFKTYTGLDGKPLDNGYVYFGQPDEDPITHPVTVYWDAAGTLPAAQPLRTVNGYIMNAGTPASIFYDGAYSELVKDSKDRQVFYSPTSNNFSIATVVSTFLANIASSAGASLIGFFQSGVGAVKRWVLDKLRDTIHIRDFGAACDGVTDDTQALIKADGEAVARGKTLLIDGTPLIKQALIFNGKSNWRFEGGAGVLDASNDASGSRLIKHASVNGALATFTANGVVLEGIAASGQPGNIGDGLVFWGNSPRIIGAYVTGMGQDGIRLGRDAGLAANVNSFYLENPRCISNGRDGININDEPGGAPDVNAGSLINPICTSNGRHGFYGGNSFLGVTIICPTMEANTGWGMYLDTAFRQNIIIGGDCEANVAGDMYRANKYSNIVIGTSVQGKTIYDRAQLMGYTPVITGGVAEGACIYTTQGGTVEVSGASVHFTAHISYSGHTGSGQPYISLPLVPYIGAPNVVFTPVQVVSSGIALAAGAQAVGLISRDGNRVQLYTSNAGVLAPMNLPASGTFYIRGTYPLNASNFFSI